MVHVILVRFFSSQVAQIGILTRMCKQETKHMSSVLSDRNQASLQSQVEIYGIGFAAVYAQDLIRAFVAPLRLKMQRVSFCSAPLKPPQNV